MKIERTKNATRNVLFNGMLQAMNMLVPFFMRSIIIHYLGAEYLGLGGLFKSILQILNLSELGVGSAMVFSMYKPIAEDDGETVCALMKLYRTLYRIIGLFILVIGLVLVPFLPKLIKGDVTADVNLYVLYFMTIGSTVLSYWLFAYKNCLLNAHQRIDISSKITLLVHITEYALKIAVLILFRNYYMYLGVQILTQIARNLIVAKVVSKYYPQYSPHGDLPKETIKKISGRVRDLFTSKLSYTVTNSADTLVISSFLGLTVLAIYQNYYFIISSLSKMIEVITGACIAGIGNSLITESAEKNYKDLRKMTMLFGWLMCVAGSMLLCLYQPFTNLWMGEENMLGINYVICFVVYFYSIGMNKLINLFKDAAGIWKIDKWRPLTAAILNLTLNLATVRWLGLYGVLLSTVISIVLVQIPWLFHNLFKAVFPHEYLWQYVRYYISFAVIVLAACTTSWFACLLLSLSLWPTLILNAMISFGISNVIFFAIYGRNPLLRESISQIIGVVIKRK